MRIAEVGVNKRKILKNKKKTRSRPRKKVRFKKTTKKKKEGSGQKLS